MQDLLTDRHWNELSSTLAHEYWQTLDETPSFLIKRLDDGSIALTHRSLRIKTWPPEWIEEARSETGKR